MVSLQDSTDTKLNEYLKLAFHGHVGALSILVEAALLEYFENHALPGKRARSRP